MIVKGIAQQRIYLKKALKDLPVSVREQCDKLIERRLCMASAFQNAQHIALYYSFAQEVSTHELIGSLLRGGKRVCLPALDRSDMIFRWITGLDECLQGKYGIKAPAPPCSLAHDEFDVIVLPCIGVDGRGHRIGRGKGYYDRYLARLSPHIPRIALAYEVQVLDAITPAAHDEKVDCIVTEKRVIEVKQER